MLVAGMMVTLAGIDMPEIHATDVKNPRKKFPRAILTASTGIISLFIAGRWLFL